MEDNNALTAMVAAFLAAIAVLLVFFSMQDILGKRTRLTRLQVRLDRRSRTGQSTVTEPEEPLEQFGNWLRSLAERIGEKVAGTEKDETNEAGLDLIRAGYRTRRAPMMLWGIKAGLTLAGLLLGLMIKLVSGDAIPTGMLALLFVFPAMMGLYLPNMWISSRIKSRKHEITNSMPDALDLLVVSVEAGMGLDQALVRVARELHDASPLLSEELTLVTLELRAGKSRSEALKNLAMRVNVEDVTSLVTLIIQADAFGTSVASTLRVYSDTMRTTRFQRAEEIAAKMPVKLLFPLVFCILPALFVTIMGPAFIRLMQVFAQMGQ